MMLYVISCRHVSFFCVHYFSNHTVRTMQTSCIKPIKSRDRELTHKKKMSRRHSEGCLFIGRLSKNCRVRDLEDVFEPYGRMSRCEIKYGKIITQFCCRKTSQRIVQVGGVKLSKNFNIHRTVRMICKKLERLAWIFLFII